MLMAPPGEHTTQLQCAAPPAPNAYGPARRTHDPADLAHRHNLKALSSILSPVAFDAGLNVHFGARVFVNADCKFQDQGGIWIGDGALIGHNCVFATLDHDEDPARRSTLHPRPIILEENVRIGWPVGTEDQDGYPQV